MEEIQASTNAETSDTEASRTRRVLRNIGIAFGILVLLAAIGFAIYGLATHPQATATVRDLFIIVLALVTVIIGVFLLVLIFQLQSLIALLRNEIKPILESANDTASTVRGTTTFVSDTVVTPVIQAASLVAGIRQTLRVLAGNGRKKGQARASQAESTED